MAGRKGREEAMRHHAHVVFAALAAASCAWTEDLPAASAPQLRAIDCIWIRTVEQLQAMRKNLAGTYCLANDIDASGVKFVPVGRFNVPPQDPEPFFGRFYGNGHAIRNLTIRSSAGHVGLFGMAEGAVIQDVRLIDVRVTGVGSTSAGALVGIAGGGVAISGVHVSGQVKCTGATCNAGGIVGRLGLFPGPDTIRESSSSANVAGTWHVGGALGWLDEGTVSQVHATGRVTCVGFMDFDCLAGGLIGQSSAEVNLSFATGQVAAEAPDETWVGGLIGHSSGPVTLSFATGPVAADGAENRAGGLIGYSSGDVSRSHAAGPVSGGASGYAAGLIAELEDEGDATVEQTYAVGRITSSGALTRGLIGLANVDRVSNSYWDGDTTLQRTSAGGTVLNTVDLRAGLPPGFLNAWAINKGLSYPFLNYLELDFTWPLATLVRSNLVFTFLPISQDDASQYITPPVEGDDTEKLSIATIYAMIARAVGVAHDVPYLANVKIDKYFWDAESQSAIWRGPVRSYARLGAVIPIPAGEPLNGPNIIRRMNTEKLVILRARYRRGDGSTARHWLLGTLYTEKPNGAASAVVAHDPLTGQQIVIDPETKQVLAPLDFPLELRINGYQPVTVN
jgi:hypothetical protein